MVGWLAPGAPPGCDPEAGVAGLAAGLAAGFAGAGADFLFSALAMPALPRNMASTTAIEMFFIAR